ncbi:DUF3892 domain-containing protein [Streptomyces sp. NPDC059575]|uniref:DUF3892 domain-containing protein n=1 Tax=Streptomyces sp. NPDC059575 TaxID=3346872 RepID=UPI0036A6AFCB
MAIQITARRMSGGNTHQHIAELRWTEPSTGKSGRNPRADIVGWIENKNIKAYTDDGRGNRADVGVVTPSHGAKYLRTHADGVWTNNLLELPEF